METDAPLLPLWKKGDAPRRFRLPWLYVVLREWRHHAAELKAIQNIPPPFSGTAVITVYVDPDNGTVHPGHGLVLIESQASRAIRHMVATLRTPLGTYILCPASHLEFIIDYFDSDCPGWHEDPSKIDPENWRQLVEGSPRPTRKGR